MKTFQNCPECGKGLSEQARLCRCGWKSPVQPDAPRADGRCAYHIAERRCPLPGTICHHPYSKEGPWYCAGHARCLDDPRLGEAVLHHAEENYYELLAQRRDWRDVAIAKRLSAAAWPYSAQKLTNEEKNIPCI